MAVRDGILRDGVIHRDDEAARGTRRRRRHWHCVDRSNATEAELGDDDTAERDDATRRERTCIPEEAVVHDELPLDADTKMIRMHADDEAEEEHRDEQKARPTNDETTSLTLELEEVHWMDGGPMDC